MRELVGTLFALRHPKLRGRQNLLARKKSLYCSAFVQFLFRRAGIDLAPGIHGKNTTPDDIWRTLVPHTSYLLNHNPIPSVKPSLATRLLRRTRRRLGKFADH